MRKIGKAQTNIPKLVLIKVLSDIHRKLGNEYVPYNKFLSKTLTKVNTKQTDIKNIYPDSIVSNTDQYDIKHTSTPKEHLPNTINYHIKHTIIPTKH